MYPIGKLTGHRHPFSDYNHFSQLLLFSFNIGSVDVRLASAGYLLLLHCLVFIQNGFEIEGSFCQEPFVRFFFVGDDLSKYLLWQLQDTCDDHPIRLVGMLIRPV